MNPTHLSTLHHDIDLVSLSEVALALGVSPAALFQAACRKEITLIRDGSHWACTWADAEAFAAKMSSRTLPPRDGATSPESTG